LDRWSRSSTAGKKPCLSPEELAPWTATNVEKLTADFSFDIITWIRRHRRTSEDLKHPKSPRNPEREEDEGSTAKLRRTSPSKGTSPAAKRHTTGRTTSTPPAASSQATPTLYTHRDLGIPHPPAVGAAGGGGGNPQITGGEVEERGGSQIRPQSTVARERGRSTYLL
jgi:hypothetical protein